MKITLSNSVSNVQGEADIKRFMALFQDQVTSILNNGIIFTDNFNAKILSFSFSSANKTIGMNHGLNSIPTGYLLIGSNNPLSIYDGDEQNTTKDIYLKSSAIGVARVLVFV